MKKIFLVFLISLSLAFVIFAQDDKIVEESESLKELEFTITEINVNGLKRTKDRYVQNLLSGFIGLPANEETVKGIYITLQSQNLFNEIQVSITPLSPTDVAVNISLKEKLSFLPLPFMAVSNGSFMAGLFVMDMNAFGVHDTFVTGGLYSKDMIMGVGAYTKQPHKKGDFGFSGSFSIFKREYNFTDAYNSTIFEYESFSAGCGAKLLYKPTNLMNLSFGTDYNFFNPLDCDSLFRMNTWSLNLGWSISKPSWNGIFLSSNSISISPAIHFSDDADYRVSESIVASAKLQINVAQKIRLLGAVNGFWGNDLHYSKYQNRDIAGVSILRKNFRTQEILGLSAGAEFCLAKLKFGMITAYALYQAAFAQDWDKSLYIGHGPEAGLRVYLAKIAMPAISMGGSYNVANNFWQYSFSLGMGF